MKVGPRNDARNVFKVKKIKQRTKEVLAKFSSSNISLQVMLLIVGDWIYLGSFTINKVFWDKFDEAIAIFYLF